MPVSVVVGGQYGSEGKGKVALELVRRDPSITIAVRPGGTNSGHTGYRADGRRVVLRQLPAACIDARLKVVLPPGSYIDVDLLERELAEVGLPSSQLVIDPRANVITPAHVKWEMDAELTRSIGSTGSGTGAAVLSRLARCAPQLPSALSAAESPRLRPYVADTTAILRAALNNAERILIEGTQGFGLSPYHGDAWPKATSRDTTASAFLSESGLSPMDVDEVVLVLRCHPIRVAGDSGPLPKETSWKAIAEDSGAPEPFDELTSVTKQVRRVAFFDEGVVRHAIAVNAPTRIVLNHLDYVDWTSRDRLTDLASQFVSRVEARIGRPIDLVGTGPATLHVVRPVRAEAA